MSNSTKSSIWKCNRKCKCRYFRINGGNNLSLQNKAVNSLGTTLGNDLAFTTIVDDIEGNHYKTVKIGTQVWTLKD